MYSIISDELFYNLVCLSDGYLHQLKANNPSSELSIPHASIKIIIASLSIVWFSLQMRTHDTDSLLASLLGSSVQNSEPRDHMMCERRFVCSDVMCHKVSRFAHVAATFRSYVLRPASARFQIFRSRQDDK